MNPMVPAEKPSCTVSKTSLLSTHRRTISKPYFFAFSRSTSFFTD